MTTTISVAPTIDASIVGLEIEPQRAMIDARWLMAYSAAAGAHEPPYFDTILADGPLAHPLFPVCYEWPLLLEIRARAIDAAVAPYGVHASHRLILHRLPRAGQELASTAHVTAVVTRRSGTLVLARMVTRDVDGSLVSETDYGSLYRGVTLVGPAHDETTARTSRDGSAVVDGGRRGDEGLEPRPDASGRGAAHAPPIETARWTERVDVPYHLGHVYTECARIWNPIHTDRAVARAAGLPGPILHGTATLALAVSRILARDLDGDARAVRGIEARFAGMVPLPSTFTVRAGAHEPDRIAFEAVDKRGARVLAEGALRL